MPKHTFDSACDEHQDEQLRRLQQAADEGWPAIAASRYVDVTDEALEGFTTQLGRRDPLRFPVAEG